MHNLKHIRTEVLNITQEQMGGVLGCTQGNVLHYEKGKQALPVDRAWRIIEHAKTLGILLTLNDIYRAPQKEVA